MAKLHFACQGQGEHCLYSRGFFTMRTRNPRVWIHLMFLALQAKSQSALSSRETSVSSLKNCWDILKCENKSFLTLVTSAFPCSKVITAHYIYFIQITLISWKLSVIYYLRFLFFSFLILFRIKICYYTSFVIVAFLMCLNLMVLGKSGDVSSATIQSELSAFYKQLSRSSRGSWRKRKDDGRSSKDGGLDTSLSQVPTSATEEQ